MTTTWKSKEMNQETLEELTEAQEDDFVNLFGDEYDIEVVVADEDIVDATAEPELDSLQVVEVCTLWKFQSEQTQLLTEDFIRKELARLVPASDKMESTIDAFNRLTSDHSWIPFRMPDSSIPACECWI